MNKRLSALSLLFFGVCLPKLRAQSVDFSQSNMDVLLEDVYNTVVASSATFVNIACTIGVVGAVIMISSHIYSCLLRNKAIDIATVGRPFIVLLGLIFYMPFITAVNALLTPTVYATDAMVTSENRVVDEVFNQLQDTRKQSDAYQLYVGESGNGDFEKYLEANDLDAGGWSWDGITAAFSFQIEKSLYESRNQLRYILFYLLSYLYIGSVFILNTIRSFTLSILALVGPLAIAFSLFPGFQGSFTNWVGRYVTVYLWLPVANVFGFVLGIIQVKFTELAIQAAAEGGYADAGMSSSDGLYIVLLLTGAVGYFAVPTVTTYLISASGATALSGGMSGVGRMIIGSQILRSLNGGRGGGGGSGGGGGGGINFNWTHYHPIPPAPSPPDKPVGPAPKQISGPRPTR
jgi:conjugative transposon TraJ protein